MRRILLCILILITVVSTSAFAGGAGNCTQPLRTTSKWIGVGAAGEYNYMHERANNLENNKGPKDMKVSKKSDIYGKFIIGLFQYLNLYGKVGMTNYDLEYQHRQDEGSTYKVRLNDGLYVGGGLNGLVPIWKLESLPLTFGCGFDFQGSFSNNYIDTMTRIDGTTRAQTDVVFQKHGSFYSADGQNSLYLTCKYDIEKWQTMIIPYVGGYHSWMVVGTAKPMSFTVPNERGIAIENKDVRAGYDVLGFGVLVGVDVDIAKFINLNIEGRFVGETALTTGATLKF